MPNFDIKKFLIENQLTDLSRRGIMEIDWEGDFSDVSKKCINPEELKNILNDIVKGSSKDSASLPKIHSKAISMDDEGEIDVDKFISDITARPENILSVNSKMENSADENAITVNIGIPALRGLVYDEEEKTFYNINTCPGAGSCAVVCYARKGSYIQYPGVFLKQTKVLNYLLNDPQGFKGQLKSEIAKQFKKYKGKTIVFRWNDAGDFFTSKYYAIAEEITRELNQEGIKIKSYAYTKMGDIYNLEGDVIKNWSDDANKRETDKVNASESKRSVIVPKEMFYDLLKKGDNRGFERDSKGRPEFKNQEAIEILKERLSIKYKVPKESILTYDEMINTPVSQEFKKYNVVVRPKDGDISAQRTDVGTTFLLFH
jgi:hypothetical protein